MKKGQGLSFTTIVIAALALLILVILSVIFMSRLSFFTSSSSSCSAQGGICKEKCDFGDVNLGNSDKLGCEFVCCIEND